jgi:acylphosphatase
MMSLPADNIVPISPASANNVSGRIMNIQDGHIHIDHNGQTVNAQKAFSCLVEPQLNDIVLYTQDQHQQAYVIAILQRDDESSMNLQFAPNTTMASSEKLTLHSEQINQLSQKSFQKTGEATIYFQQGLIKGEKLHSHIRHIYSISDLISTMAKQAIQKFNTYVRKSDTSDQVQAAQMGRKVDGLYTMNSKHTIMVSQKETKIDGEHIHMG